MSLRRVINIIVLLRIICCDGLKPYQRHFFNYCSARLKYMTYFGLFDESELPTRYSLAVLSHETALYLLNPAEREPIRYSITLKAGTNATKLTKQGAKVYKVREELFNVSVIEAKSPAGHILKVYNPERTICNLVHSRRNIDIQDLQNAIIF